MLTTLITLAAIFAFAFLTGIGLTLLLMPSYLRSAALIVLTAPCLGLLQLAIVDGYLIASGHQIAGSIVICWALAGAEIVLWSAAWFFAGRPSVVQSSREGDGSHLRALSAAVIAVVSLAVVLAPIFRAGAPTMPFRAGIDQVGYAETAQYLLEGGTLASAKADILKKLGTSDLTKAKAHNIYAVDFGTYVDTEFLLKALRWGFPGAIASLALLTKSGHVYRVEFVSLAFSFALMLALLYTLMRESFDMPASVALVCTIAFALNANILNVYYEGQLAETFAEPFFLLLLIVFLALRRMDRRMDVRRISPDWWRGVVLFAIVLAGLFFAYNEVLVLVYGFFAATAVLDALLARDVKWRSMASIALGSVLGACLAFPISVQWISYTFANLSALSRAGFWQPHWASLAEVLGIFNMYGSTPYVLLQRSLGNEAANIAVSVLLAALIARLVFRELAMDKPFWIAAFVLLGAVYVKGRFGGGTMNYPYTKLATLLLPLLSIVLFAAAYDWVRKVLKSKYAPLVYVIPAAVLISGISYIGTYIAQGSYVTPSMFALYSYNGHRRFNDVTLEMAGRQPIIRDFMLTPLVSLNWVNEVAVPKYVAPYLNDPLAVLLWKSDLRKPELAMQTRFRVIAENSDMVVLQVRAKLADICVPQARSYRIDDLSNDPTDSWKRLPPAQCDYNVADALQNDLNSR